MAKKKKTKKKKPETIELLDDDIEYQDEDEIGVEDTDFILLVYPFAGDINKIEAAADGLNEASCIDRGAFDTTRHPQSEESGQASETMDDHMKTDTASQVKLHQKGHKVTIMVKDYKRLEPTGWLDDSLVDFWMQWYAFVSVFLVHCACILCSNTPFLLPSKDFSGREQAVYRLPFFLFSLLHYFIQGGPKSSRVLVSKEEYRYFQKEANIHSHR